MPSTAKKASPGTNPALGTWIIDPIDGTKAFTRGVPLYSNLLAVVDEHGPLIGVINLPAIGVCVYAGRGLGCFRDGRPVHVSDRATPSECVLSTSGFNPWPDPMLLGAKTAGFQLRTWGDGYGHLMVAAGRAHVMADPVMNPWDLVPVLPVLRGAGAVVTDWNGGDPLATGHVIAAAPKLHAAVMAALRD